MEQSIFSPWSGTFDHLPWIVICSWCLSFTQMVYPVVVMAGKRSQDKMRWKTIWGREPYSADVFCTLAEASSMASVQSLTIGFTQRSIDSNASMGVPVEHHLPYISELACQMRNRVVLSYNLENVIQTNIQVSVFAINAYIAGKKLIGSQIAALISIVLGILSSLAKLSEAQAFFGLLQDVNVQQLLADDYPDSDSIRALKRDVLCVRIGCVTLVLGLLYATAKLVAAFVCEDSMFNLTGCASVDL